MKIINCGRSPEIFCFKGARINWCEMTCYVYVCKRINDTHFCEFKHKRGCLDIKRVKSFLLMNYHKNIFSRIGNTNDFLNRTPHIWPRF